MQAYQLIRKDQAYEGIDYNYNVTYPYTQLNCMYAIIAYLARSLQEIYILIHEAA